MAWRKEARACSKCGAEYQPKREGQLFCSRRCRVGTAVQRHRSDYNGGHLRVVPEKRLQAVSAAPEPSASPSAPTNVCRMNQNNHLSGDTTAFTTNFTEVLKGDGYPLESYPDGFPKLPACLDRRESVQLQAAA